MSEKDTKKCSLEEILELAQVRAFAETAFPMWVKRMLTERVSNIAKTWHNSSLTHIHNWCMMLIDSKVHLHLTFPDSTLAAHLSINTTLLQCIRFLICGGARTKVECCGS